MEPLHELANDTSRRQKHQIMSGICNPAGKTVQESKPNYRHNLEGYLNRVISDAIFLNLGNIIDHRTVDNIEYYLNQHGASLKRICEEPNVLEEAFPKLFGDSAEVIIEWLLKISYGAFGFEYSKKENRFQNLETDLRKLKSMIL